MFKVKFADHIFEIDNKYNYVEKLCRDYITYEQSEKVIKVTESEVLAENKTDDVYPLEYLESLAVYRKICETLLSDDILLFHCSAIAYDNKAYLFTAPSGTGKSTHTRLWKEVFGDRVTMINDDKPLLKITDDGAVVYGTPYSGKENLNTNTSAVVASIVILQQAAIDKIESVSPSDAFPMLLNQTYRNTRAEAFLKTIGLVKKLSALPIYLLSCTPTKKAVEVVFSKLMED